MPSIYKNKMLYVLEEESGGYVPFKTVRREIFLTADLVANEIHGGGRSSDYLNAVLSPVSKRVIRVYKLNNDADETLNMDISEWISDWSVRFAYQKGGIRSGSITLMNYHNEWMPSPVNGTIWKGTKFAVQIGIYYDHVIYWRDCGIFVCGDISVNMNGMTISVPLHDKWALLDGTVGGKRNYGFYIPPGTKIIAAVKNCLEENKVFSGSAHNVVIGDPLDYKSVRFPNGTTQWLNFTINNAEMRPNVTTTVVQKPYTDIITPYTLTKDPNGTMADLIGELGTMAGLDYYYSNDGHLTFVPEAVTYKDMLQEPVLWVYEEHKNQYTRPEFSIDFSKIVSEVIVVGAIENGKQFTAYAQNTNPKSQANVYLTEPNPLYISDNNLYGTPACQDRADYEMAMQGRFGIQLKFNSIFIPHLEINNLISVHNEQLGLNGQSFMLNSIDYAEDGMSSVTATNVEEIAL